MTNRIGTCAMKSLLSVRAAAAGLLLCAAGFGAVRPVTEPQGGDARPARIPQGAGDFEIERPRPSAGACVKAVDFGFSQTNRFNGAALNRALAHCRAVRASRLELAPGTFSCFDADRGVVVADLVDFTLDGCGAELVFRRPARRHLSNADRVPDDANLLVTNCVRTRVANLKMDWDWQTDPLCDVGVVVAKRADPAASGKASFDVELEGWPEGHPWHGRPMPIQTMTPVNGDRTRLTAERPNRLLFGLCEGHFGTKMAWLSPTRVRIWPGVKEPGQYTSPNYDNYFGADINRRTVDAVPIGLRYRLFHYYYGKNGVNLHSNRHLTLEDIAIFSCFGMGVVVDGASEYTQLVRVNVEPKKGRPTSCTSDGHHIARSKGHTKFIDCRISFQNDDAFNWHDCFTLGVPHGPNRLRITQTRGFAYFGAVPGSEIELAFANFRPTGWKAALRAVEGDDLVFDRPLPALDGEHFLVFDNTYRSDYVVMKGCTLADTHFREIVQPSHVTIEDCTFLRTGGGLNVVSAHSRTLWCEGRGARDVVVRNCRFEHTQTLADEAKGGLFPELHVRASFPAPPGAKDVFTVALPPGFDRGFFSDILVENCTFVDSAGLLLQLNFGRSVMFRDNDIVLTGRRPARPSTGGFRLGAVEGVFIEKNRYWCAPGVAVSPQVEVSPEARGVVVRGNIVQSLGAGAGRLLPSTRPPAPGTQIWYTPSP